MLKYRESEKNNKAAEILNRLSNMHQVSFQRRAGDDKYENRPKFQNNAIQDGVAAIWNLR